MGDITSRERRNEGREAMERFEFVSVQVAER